jgi:hypothetical protein
MGISNGVKTTSTLVRTNGILMLLLGIVHCLGTYFEDANVKHHMSEELRLGYLIWFFGVGLYFVLIGVVKLMCYQELLARKRFAWQMALVATAFVTCTGAMGTTIYGLSPPTLPLITGAVATVALLMNRRAFSVT